VRLVHALAVQPLVDVAQPRVVRVLLAPRRMERDRVGAAALVAGPVPRRAGCRLVEEEEPRVVAGLHERPPPVVERELAGDPLPALRTPDEVAAGVDRPGSAHRGVPRYGPTTGRYG